MRTTWTGVPKELRDAATPLLHKYAHVLPGWVRLLEVTFDHEMTDDFAQVESEPSYQRVKLVFGGAWLDCDQEKRDWMVRHELAHTVLSPLEPVFESFLLALPKRLRPVFEKQYEEALEASVSGLAYALVKEVAE